MPRTTIDIDSPILRDLKRLQKREKKSLGRLVSDLLSQALAQERNSPPARKPFRWEAQDMKPRIDLSDKDALYAALDERRE